MDRGATLAALGWAIGDPSRACMLAALMGGQALTAGELAREAGVAPSTASSHLAVLSQSGLVTLLRQGRHRYYRLAGPDVARMLEGLSTFAPPGVPPRGRATAAMRLARTCYDHLAGELGVRVFDAMARDGRLAIADETASLTVSGRAFMRDQGIVTGADDGRWSCRSCLDFTERRPHLGGPVAAALLTTMLDRRWLVSGPDRRSLRPTPIGLAAIHRLFGPP